MLNPDCGIYAIVAPSGRLYIGSAVSFRRRWSGHRTHLRKGDHHCAGLQAAYAKYGLAALEFRVLELASREQLLVAEQAHMDASTVRLYNGCPRAGSPSGYKHTPETRAKVSKALKGIVRPAETRARMSAAQLGHKVSAAARLKIGVTSQGRPQSEATRAKRSKKLTGCVHKDNRTGFAGVGPFRNRYRARWANKHLGLFDTPEAAYAAVCAARGCA